MSGPKKKNIQETEASIPDLKTLVSGLNKSLKLDIKFGDDPFLEVRRIPTGEPGLDDILGGGVVRGGILILFGKESSGKTYITQRVIANAQKQGYTCAFIDAEHTYDPVWFAKSGINIQELLVIVPPTAEKALEVAIALGQAKIDIVVVDSVAALLPEEEATKGMGEWQQGLQARLINKFFRKITPENHDTAFILINQVRKAIGQGYGKYVPDALPGGKGQDFFARMKIKASPGDLLYADDANVKTDLPIGFYIKLQAVKNKTAQPMKSCEIPFYFSGETDILAQLFQIALDKGLITRAGAYYQYKDLRIMGRPKFLEALNENENEKLKEEFISDIRKEFNEYDESI